MINVLFHAASTDPTPSDVEGVIIRVFDSGGSFVTEGVTNVDGEAAFILDEESSFTLRFGSSIFTPYSIESPQRIVTGTVDANYTVEVELYSHPVADDPAMCRVSGFIKDSLGRQQRRCRVIIAPTAEIRSIGESVVVPKAFFTWTDDNGYLEVDCLRGVPYSFQIATALRESSGIDFIQFDIPDSSSAALSDLITDN